MYVLSKSGWFYCSDNADDPTGKTVVIASPVRGHLVEVLTLYPDILARTPITEQVQALYRWRVVVVRAAFASLVTALALDMDYVDLVAASAESQRLTSRNFSAYALAFADVECAGVRLQGCEPDDPVPDNTVLPAGGSMDIVGKPAPRPGPIVEDQSVEGGTLPDGRVVIRPKPVVIGPSEGFKPTDARSEARQP